MDTISKRLKDTLRGVMQEDMIYSNEDFRRLIYEKTGMAYKSDYMETHFAGCLSALRKSGEIIQVRRGEYKRGTVKRRLRNTDQAKTVISGIAGQAAETVLISQVKADILQSVRQELTYLRSLTKNIVISFDTPEEEIQYMLKCKELVRNLEQFERQADA